MKPFVVYTALRIVLFAATWGIVLGIWVLVAGQADLLFSLIIAFVVSGVGSYVLLQGPRARFAERVEARADRMVSRFDELRSTEDEAREEQARQDAARDAREGGASAQEVGHNDGGAREDAGA